MRKLLLKLLGIDSDFEQELIDLKQTIESLKVSTTELYNNSLIVKELSKETNRETNEFWWDENIDVDGDFDKYIQKCKIMNGGKLKWVNDHKSLKIHKIFHGGCLGCKTPERDGIGTCVGCQYFVADWSLPNLYKKD